MRRRIAAGCLLSIVLCEPTFADAVLAQGLPTAPQAPPPAPFPGPPPSPPIGPVSLEPDTDRPGQDYAAYFLPRPDVELCRSACEHDVKCVAYTYVHPGFSGPDATCWLKATIPQPVSNHCCISGMR